MCTVRKDWHNGTSVDVGEYADREIALRIAKFYVDDFVKRNLGTSPKDETETIADGFRVTYTFLGKPAIFSATIVEKIS